MNRTGSPRHPHPQSWTTHSHPDSLTSLYLTAISQTPWGQASRMTGAGQEATAQWLASYGVTFSRSHNHTATKCHLTLPLTKTQNPKALSTSSLHWFEHLYAANMEKKKKNYICEQVVCVLQLVAAIKGPRLDGDFSWNCDKKALNGDGFQFKPPF